MADWLIFMFWTVVQMSEDENSSAECLLLFMSLLSCFWSNISVASYYQGWYQHKQSTSFCMYVSDILSLSLSACCHLLLNEMHHEKGESARRLQATVIKKQERFLSVMHDNSRWGSAVISYILSIFSCLFCCLHPVIQFKTVCKRKQRPGIQTFRQ